jgi:hypothetical protein
MMEIEVRSYKVILNVCEMYRYWMMVMCCVSYQQENEMNESNQR